MKVNTTKEAKLLGRYIVADPGICHGKPTFRGTRIMVWQVLEMVADGKAWETIVEEWRGSITKEAIAEAVQADFWHRRLAQLKGGFISRGALGVAVC